MTATTNRVRSQLPGCLFQSRGFTLIELLIVMAVMSAMAAISLPSLQRTLRTYRILGDARGIAQTLTLAKMRSAANFTIEAVNWDPSNKSFSMKYFRKNPAQFEPGARAALGMAPTNCPPNAVRWAISGEL